MHVRAQRARGVGPGLAATLDCAGQVDDAVGPDRGHRGLDRGARPPGPPPAARTPRAGAPAACRRGRTSPYDAPASGCSARRKLHQVAAHEAGDAGDEDAHGLTAL